MNKSMREGIVVVKSLGLYRQCSGRKKVEASRESEPEHCRYGDLQ